MPKEPGEGREEQPGGGPPGGTGAAGDGAGGAGEESADALGERLREIAEREEQPVPGEGPADGTGAGESAAGAGGVEEGADGTGAGAGGTGAGAGGAGEGADEDLPASVTDPQVRHRFAEMRTRLREERAAREQAEARLTQGQAGGEQSGQAGGERQEQRTPEQRAADNARAFELLDQSLQFLDGQMVEAIADEAQANRIRQAGYEVLDAMPRAEVLTVLQRARRGEFGDASGRIGRLATEQLQVAGAREQTEAERRQAQEREVEQQRQAYAQALEGVYEKWPALRVKEGEQPGPEARYALEWLEQNVGTAEKPGWLYTVQAAGPENVQRVMELCMRDWEAQQNRGAAQERDELRRQMGQIESPESSGHPPGGGGPARESDRLRQQIIERAGITETDEY